MCKKIPSCVVLEVTNGPCRRSPEGKERKIDGKKARLEKKKGKNAKELKKERTSNRNGM